MPWRDLIPRLLLYTHQQFRRKSLGSVNIHLHPDDLVAGAIEKTIAGDRRWDPADRSLFEHLSSVINSDMYNEIRKAFHRHEIPIDEAIINSLATEATSVEQELQYKEDLASILSFIRGRDPSLLKLVSAAVLTGTGKPRDIAALLNMPVDQVYWQRQKLRRLLNRYLVDDAERQNDARRQIP